MTVIPKPGVELQPLYGGVDPTTGKYSFGDIKVDKSKNGFAIIKTKAENCDKVHVLDYEISYQSLDTIEGDLMFLIS